MFINFNGPFNYPEPNDNVQQNKINTESFIDRVSNCVYHVPEVHDWRIKSLGEYRVNLLLDLLSNIFKPAKDRITMIQVLDHDFFALKKDDLENCYEEMKRKEAGVV